MWTFSAHCAKDGQSQSFDAMQAGSSTVGLANDEMWRAAARNLELSEQQKKALCQLRRLFMQKQEALIAHRQRSIAALQAAVPNAASSHDIAAQFLKVTASPFDTPDV